MKNFVKIFFFLSAVGIVLIACRSSMLAPTFADETLAKQTWSNSSLPELKKGFDLYVNKCAGCHYLHKPTEFSAELWKKDIPEMGKRAFLNADEEEMILHYVLTKREVLLANSNSSK